MSDQYDAQGKDNAVEFNWEENLYLQVKSCVEHLILMKKNNYYKVYNKILCPVMAATVECAMIRCKGNQSKAARLLGISRGTLRAHLKRFFDRLDIGAVHN